VRLRLLEAIEDLEPFFREREAQILAFVPESDRFDRLRREAEMLSKCYPHAEGTLALRGTLVGVKDVIHVRGLPTRAGSRLPPHVLRSTEAPSAEVRSTEAPSAEVRSAEAPSAEVRSAEAQFAEVRSAEAQFAEVRSAEAPGAEAGRAEAQDTEAECVTRLKLAGALILGKTHTSEFAYTAPTPTRNPRHLEHTPGGSSSGSAAAVAAGLCSLALGTQTTGSIIRPAAYCGVVGFKPSYDRISRGGVIPLAPSIDHLGVFTSDVSSAAQAASLLCVGWQSALSSRPRPVLGIPEGPYLMQASDVGWRHFETVCQKLAEAGFEVKSVPAMPDFDDIAARHNVILEAEAAAVHAEWFEAYRGLFHPQTVEMIRRGQSIPAATLDRARDGCRQLRTELMALMRARGVDLWLSPSTPGPAPKGLASTGDAIMNLPWTHSGLPTLNLPAGRNAAGLPLGLQVTAGWYADEDLLAWGGTLEQILIGKA
jgi:Asp-tRNA(Asn)/Glu-tRNA(Gln) amidotransferase A subunit family amidase